MTGRKKRRMTENKRGCGYVEGENRCSEDSYRLLEIFPEEIWLQVFHHLKDSEDLKNVGNASPVWREMLQRRKVEYLFPDVWTLVRGSHRESDEGDTSPEETDPREEGHCSGGILKLRLVSRAWKKALDHFYFIQALPSAFAKTGSKYANAGKLEDTWTDKLLIWDTATITKCLAHFEHTPPGESGCRPFLNGRVCFSAPLPANNPQRFRNFEGAVSRLLQAYGRHILICGFELNVGDVSETFPFLCQSLSHLPNLVSLCIHCRPHPTPDIDLRPHFLLTSPPPLPNLPHLEYLYLSNFSPLVSNVLVQTYNHVAILHLHPGPQMGDYDVASQPFPNLVDLEITFDTIFDFQKLQTAQFSGAFRELRVTLDMSRPPLQKLFVLSAQKWGTSLKTLQIHIPSLHQAPKGERDRLEREVQSLKRHYLPEVRVEWFNKNF